MYTSEMRHNYIDLVRIAGNHNSFGVIIVTDVTK